MPMEVPRKKLGARVKLLKARGRPKKKKESVGEITAPPTRVYSEKTIPPSGQPALEREWGRKMTSGGHPLFASEL